MLRSFNELAGAPESPLKPQPANARDVVAWLQAAQAMRLSQSRFDALDALRDWRNRKYRAGQLTTSAEVDEAIGLVKPFQADVARWFADAHPALMKQGLGDGIGR